MKNLILTFGLILTSVVTFAADTVTDDTRASISFSPRLVRENPVPQVFFGEEGSYYIATGSMEAYNRIMGALNVAVRTHTKVHLIVNKRTGLIIDADGAPPPTKVSIYDDSEDTTNSNAKDKSAGAPNGQTPKPGAVVPPGPVNPMLSPNATMPSGH